MSDQENELSIAEQGSGDFELDWIYARHENGDGVADIARELEKSESYVYARMRRVQLAEGRAAENVGVGL